MHTLTFDLGDESGNVDKIRHRSKTLGSKNHYHIDAKHDFVNGYVVPAIMANARVGQAHPPSSSLTRPLMVKKALEMIRKNQLPLDGFLHGSVWSQNNGPRFNNALQALAPHVRALTPGFTGEDIRAEQVAYLRDAFGIQFVERAKAAVSEDRNLWCNEAEDDILNVIELPADEALFFADSKTPAGHNAVQKEHLDIEFVGGVPLRFAVPRKVDTRVSIELSGKPTNLLHMILALNKIGAAKKIGWHSMYEGRAPNAGLRRRGFSGNNRPKTREIHFGPGAEIILQAHNYLEHGTVPEPLRPQKEIADIKWREHVVAGRWFHKGKDRLENLIREANKHVTGVVRVQLTEYSCRPIAANTAYGKDFRSIQRQIAKTRRVRRAKTGVCVGQHAPNTLQAKR